MRKSTLLTVIALLTFSTSSFAWKSVTSHGGSSCSWTCNDGTTGSSNSGNTTLNGCVAQADTACGGHGCLVVYSSGDPLQSSNEQSQFASFEKDGDGEKVNLDVLKKIKSVQLFVAPSERQPSIIKEELQKPEEVILLEQKSEEKIEDSQSLE